jgi:hypothetical protein
VNIIFWDITPCSPLKVNFFPSGIFLDLFYPEDGGDMFLRNVSWLSASSLFKITAVRTSNPEQWMSYSQKTITCPYAEPDESSSHSFILVHQYPFQYYLRVGILSAGFPSVLSYRNFVPFSYRHQTESLVHNSLDRHVLYSSKINLNKHCILLYFYQPCVSIIDATDVPTLSIIKAPMFLLCIKNLTLCFCLPLCVCVSQI